MENCLVILMMSDESSPKITATEETGKQGQCCGEGSVGPLDSPQTLAFHRALVRNKSFLSKIYQDVYRGFATEQQLITFLNGKSVEIGSGGGFLKEILPEVITTDVIAGEGIDQVLNGSELPFADGELKSIFLLNVLHHLPAPQTFFAEAHRTLVRGGRIVMTEPCRSWWSRLLYKNFHHEPFDDSVKEWTTESKGRLTTSNQAMAWIIFHRDRALFEQRFPSLKLIQVTYQNVFCYPLSGGLSKPALTPTFMYGLLSALDRQLCHLPTVFPLFETIVLEKI